MKNNILAFIGCINLMIGLSGMTTPKNVIAFVICLFVFAFGLFFLKVWYDSEFNKDIKRNRNNNDASYPAYFR